MEKTIVMTRSVNSAEAKMVVQTIALKLYLTDANCYIDWSKRLLNGGAKLIRRFKLPDAVLTDMGTSCLQKHWGVLENIFSS